MQRMRLAVIVLVGSLLGGPFLWTAPGVSAEPPDPEVIPARWVVTLAEGVSPDDIVQEHGLRPSHVYRHAVNGFAVGASDASVNRLRRDPRVTGVGQDRRIVAHDTVPTGVNRVDAEPGATGAKTGLGVRVAVLDTGIDADHPDLAANIDPIHSCSFIGAKTCGVGSPPVWDDDNGHGSHVSGTIAAANNGTGLVGVATGATVIALKVLDSSGSGSFADITAAVDYLACSRTAADCNGDGLADPPIHAANMSLGARCSVCTDTSIDPTIAAFHGAVTGATNAGVVIIVSAGNEGLNAVNSVPASFDEVITVSAFVDLNGAGGSSSGCVAVPGAGKYCDENMAKFSNYGPDVDVAAPGFRINSTYKDGGYTSLNGTSMASPHVAGAVALYLEGRVSPANGADVATVRAIVRASGECAPGGVVLANGWCNKRWTGDKDSTPYWEPLVDAQALASLPIQP